MSRQNDDINSSRLRKFLEENKGQDAFEQEALEGFSMLENNDEAINLKSELDKRIDNELLSKTSHPRKLYWVAVAGMLLIVGMSVFLIVSNDTVLPQKQIVINENTKPEFRSATPDDPSDAAVVKEAPALNDNPGVQVPVKRIPVVTAEPEPENKTTSEDVKPAEPMTGGGLASASQAVPVSPQESSAADMAVIERNASAGSSEESGILSEKKFTRQKNNKGENAPSSVNATPSESLQGRVTYEGGDAELNKHLRRVLEKSIKKFDATLKINAQNKVIEVILDNAFDLDAVEQKEVVKTLKSLEKFSSPGSQDMPGTQAYKVTFRR